MSASLLNWIAQRIKLSRPQLYRDIYNQGAYDARFSVDRVYAYKDYHEREAYMRGYRDGAVREAFIDLKERLSKFTPSAELDISPEALKIAHALERSHVPPDNGAQIMGAELIRLATNAAPHVADHSPIGKTGAGDSGLTGADVRAAAPSESEQCHYCGVSYQKPVSYHHSEEECAENQCAAPSETPRTDAPIAGDAYEALQVMRKRARQLERELAEAREGWDRCLKLATTEHFKRHEAERSNHSANKEASPDEEAMRAMDIRDATRYRWLRAQKHVDIAACWLLPLKFDVSDADQFDAAIDAAMQEHPNV